MSTSLQKEAEKTAEPIIQPDQIAVFGPASLSNLGPGFDTLGLCLDNLGDVVEIWPSERPGVRVVQGQGAVDINIPTDPMLNTAARAAAAVLRRAQAKEGVVLRVKKGIPLGSGIGGSAASAVAGAWAVNVLLGHPFEKDQLLDAVLEGETVASGSRHGDNVLPALLGGLVLVSPTDPVYYRKIELPEALTLVVITPKIEVLTQQARTLLPAQVPFHAAIHNAADLAFMLDAFRAGDWETVGRHMMKDRLVEPVRATLVPCYTAVREAAMAAGALGCALSGSGPAMFALIGVPSGAEKVRQAMLEACKRTHIVAKGYITHTNLEGVRVV